MKYLLCITSILLFPLNVLGLSITDYYVDLEVQDNARVFVNEQVTYVFDQNKDAQTIVHEIPLRYSLSSGRRQSMQINDVSARVNNKPVEVSFVSDEKTASITITPPLEGFSGKTHLDLSYEVESTIAYYDMYNEINWPLFTNVIDSNINLAAGSIQIPSQFRALRAECLVIREGEEYNCNIPARLEGGYVGYFAHMGTQAGDEVSMKIQFDTGVEVTIRSVSWNVWEWALVFGGILFALGMVVVGFIYSRIQIKEYFEKKTRDRN